MQDLALQTKWEPDLAGGLSRVAREELIGHRTSPLTHYSISKPVSKTTLFVARGMFCPPLFW